MHGQWLGVAMVRASNQLHIVVMGQTQIQTTNIGDSKHIVSQDI